MKWFVDLATRTKLFLSFGLMIVFMLVVIGAVTGADSHVTPMRASSMKLKFGSTNEARRAMK